MNRISSHHHHHHFHQNPLHIYCIICRVTAGAGTHTINVWDTRSCAVSRADSSHQILDYFHLTRRGGVTSETGRENETPRQLTHRRKVTRGEEGGDDRTPRLVSDERNVRLGPPSHKQSAGTQSEGNSLGVRFPPFRLFAPGGEKGQEPRDPTVLATQDKAQPVHCGIIHFTLH
jgi:hypothetical protein